MGALSPTRPVLDVSKTPTVVFGTRSLIWWGQWGLMLIEGTMFAIFFATYFFLRTRSSEWPPGYDNPAMRWGTANLVLLLLSTLPNAWLKKKARDADLAAIRIGLIAMVLIAVVNVLFRALEFPSLNCTYDGNAYGSAVWTLLGFHTFHLVTDLCDTAVLTALMWFGPVEGKRYDDVHVNCVYWYFVVFTYIPTYLIVYWAPRWL
jgi:cytochrome c oxidase subunit III